METKVAPQDRAFNELYFIKLLCSNPAANYNNAHVAKLNEPRLAELIKALTPEQLQYLIEKIESKM